MKILCIDDDGNCRVAGSRCLTVRCGHETQTAADGPEGLRKAAEFGPDLIILDLRMPGMDGFEVLERLAGDPRTRAIPVVILTGAFLEDAEKARLEENSNFLMLEQKPVEFGPLMERVQARLPSFGREPAAGTQDGSFAEA